VLERDNSVFIIENQLFATSPFATEDIPQSKAVEPPHQDRGKVSWLTATPSPAELPSKDFPADDQAPAIDEVTSTYPALVAGIQQGDEGSMEKLYAMFSGGIRFYLCRQLGAQELEDKVHDTFLIVVGAIQRGELREPERLMGFVRTIVRRQVAAYIDSQVQSRREILDIESGYRVADSTFDPEQRAMREQKVEIMAQVLRGVSRRDREILIRFYIDEQTQEQICDKMGLSETQFRLLKSRAKARFGELGRRKLTKVISDDKSMRKSAGSAHS
jgi:RNA polymerase sigma-70 factor (ECF subfamily)